MSDILSDTPFPHIHQRQESFFQRERENTKAEKYGISKYCNLTGQNLKEELLKGGSQEKSNCSLLSTLPHGPQSPF